MLRYSMIKSRYCAISLIVYRLRHATGDCIDYLLRVPAYSYASPGSSFYFARMVRQDTLDKHILQSTKGK